MKPIPLESATKDEIIAAIREEYAFPDVRRRLEKAIYHIRCQKLLTEMREACEGMEANAQNAGMPIDWEKIAKRNQWQKKWDTANKALSKLQDQ